jgi:DNA-binding transcriptional regulator PaaX
VELSRKKLSLTEKILKIIYASIMETGSFIYPYKGFGRFFKNYEGALSKTIYDLKRHGYIEEVEINGQKRIKLLPKGRLKLIKRKVTKNWDGYWRIISFDIEEKRRKTRDVFRDKLSELRCVAIQKSVWITPHDISFELQELTEILNLEDNVDYFVAKAMTNEEKYLKLFNI